MQARYSVFNSHLDAAHTAWKRVLCSGKFAVDATCGNGHDTLVLAQTGAQVLACDIQTAAVAKTREQVKNYPLVRVEQLCHTSIEQILHGRPIDVLVYNLGYLPGEDKNLTTLTTSTLLSLEQLLPNIAPGGLVSVTCYPGHPEGACEETALLAWASQLPKMGWSSTHTRWINRLKAPSLFLLQRDRSLPRDALA